MKGEVQRSSSRPANVSASTSRGAEVAQLEVSRRDSALLILTIPRPLFSILLSTRLSIPSEYIHNGCRTSLFLRLPTDAGPEALGQDVRTHQSTVLCLSPQSPDCEQRPYRRHTLKYTSPRADGSDMRIAPRRTPTTSSSPSPSGRRYARPRREASRTCPSMAWSSRSWSRW